MQDIGQAAQKVYWKTYRPTFFFKIFDEPSGLSSKILCAVVFSYYDRPEN